MLWDAITNPCLRYVSGWVNYRGDVKSCPLFVIHGDVHINTGPLCGESPATHNGPVIDFDGVFVDSLIKPLNKQLSDWWNKIP